MYDEKVTIYISENCANCEKLISYLDHWDINYEIKNVTKDKTCMKELQDKGIYGTPATIIGKNNEQIVLGTQINKLKRLLGIDV